jgi:hypothetical protein
MNRIYLIIFSCISAFSVMAQSKNDVFIKKEKLTPVGTKWVADNLYLDYSEAANIHILEFLHFIKKDSSKEYYSAMLPDSTVNWNLLESDIIIYGSFNSFYVDSTGFMYNSILDQHFLRYPGWRFYPAIGISYYQAKEYCKWRSNSVTLAMNRELEKKRKSYSVKYTYYLPEITEYLKASDSTIPSKPLKGKLIRGLRSLNPDFNKKDEFYNAAINQVVPSAFKNRRILIEGLNFYGYIENNSPNTHGMYNLYGNVSEISSEEGKSFGGAWIHTKDEILKDPVFNYQGPQSWLGFRCACKVEVIPN